MIANIALDDALILRHARIPAGLNFRERQAASQFFTDVYRAISPEAPDVPKLVEIAKQHQLTFAAPPG